MGAVMLGNIIVYTLLALILGLIVWWAIGRWEERDRDTRRLSQGERRAPLGIEGQSQDDLLGRG
jgi:hypothetical protein